MTIGVFPPIGVETSVPLGIEQGGTGATTAANARTNLGLGTLATQNANAVAITGGTVTGATTLDISAPLIARTIASPPLWRRLLPGSGPSSAWGRTALTFWRTAPRPVSSSGRWASARPQRETNFRLRIDVDKSDQVRHQIPPQRQRYRRRATRHL